MVLKLSKKVHFLQFCAGLSKKSKSIEAIYIYKSERSLYTFSENGILLCYDLLFQRYKDLKLKNFVKFLLSQYLLDILVASIL